MNALHHTIYHDRIAGLTVTARPGPDGQWIVNFMRRKRMHKQLDQCAARLVPPAALAAVEAWLVERAAVEVAS